MIGEQKAKALFAGGIALFVTGLVVLMLFVIPATQHSQVAMAQDDMPPDDAGGMPPGADPGAMPPADPGAMPPGGPGAMPGGMPGAGAAAPAAPASNAITGAPPLEPSRPNPFAPRSATALAETGAMVTATTYGPDWSQLPIAERVAFVAPAIPAAPTPPLPPLQAPPEEQIRITSILWDASGQAQAAYEGPEGDTGVLRPGDRIEGFTVTQISRSGATLENPRTGESQQLELQPRAERREEPRERQPSTRRGQTGGQQGGQQQGGQQPTGRQRPTGQQGGGRPQFPAAP